jgi:Fic family protein
MSQLEFFLHDHNQQEFTTIFLKSSLAHVQFEMIHPFLDGNGRLGRLMITLLLCYFKVLRLPILYLSLYFKVHRDKYYELLNHVRITGDWEAWLEFFADAVYFTATGGLETAHKLYYQAEDDREKIITLGRSAHSAQIIHKVLLERPLATQKLISLKTGLPHPTVNRARDNLTNLGIIKEITSNKRCRIFSYHNLISIYNETILE